MHGAVRALFLTLLRLCSCQPLPKVALVSSLRKIRPHDSLPAPSLVKISAAGNEYESFQIAVAKLEDGREQSVQKIAVQFSGRSKTCAEELTRNVRVHRVAHINVSSRGALAGRFGAPTRRLVQ